MIDMYIIGPKMKFPGQAKFDLACTFNQKKMKFDV